MAAPFPSDPWELLGVNRSEATERSVKSSYAKLLKQYRPDQHPEEFQLLRQAYETALETVRHRVPAPEIPDPLSETPVTDEPPPLPDHFEELSQRLAAQLTAQEAPPNQQDLFLQIFRDFPSALNGSERWLGLLDHLLERQTKALAFLMKPDQMLALLELEDSHTFCTVLETWKTALQIDRMVELRRFLQLRHYEPKSAATAVATARFACLLAVHDPNSANQLLTLAFPLLPLQHRPRLLAAVEHRIHVGKVLTGMPTKHQFFWERCLYERETPTDWTQESAEQALDYLRKNFGYGWHGYQILGQILPESELARLDKTQATMSRLKNKPTPKKSQSMTKWYALLLGLILISKQCTQRFSSEKPQRTTPVPARRA